MGKGDDFIRASVCPIGTGSQSGVIFPFDSHKHVFAKEERKAPIEAADSPTSPDVIEDIVGKVEAFEVGYLK